jgi:hypothetical protein
MRADGIGDTIAQQEWLKPTEETLQNLLHKAFGFSGGRSIKNFVHGTWIGHPFARHFDGCSDRRLDCGNRVRCTGIDDRPPPLCSGC